jgi:hypothetical protein
MLGLFGKSRFLDADIEDWCLETWAWLLINLGGLKRQREMQLVLATRDFFPPTDAVGHERALYVFERVKLWMGMQDWACELHADDRGEQLQRVGTFNALQHRRRAPDGTFRIEDGQVVITYAADLVAQPRRLIATLSHELAHYLLASVRKPIPGGNDLRELATELTAAYCGFGLFGANDAFNFQQHQDAFGQGWSTGRRGYFSESTWAFAIALFTTLNEIEVPKGELKDSVAHLTRRAIKYLKRNPERLEPLKAIQ